MLSLLWKYGALYCACFVVAGLVNLILEDGSPFKVIPLLKLAKTGDILGEYLDDLGVSYLAVWSSSLGR